MFGDTAADSAADVLQNWDRIKVEQEGQSELFADVPENLPALLYARKLQRRSASRGDGEGLAPDTGVALERARDRIAALDSVVGRDEVERLLGDALFAVVDAARQLRADPELALRAAAQRFRDGE